MFLRRSCIMSMFLLVALSICAVTVQADTISLTGGSVTNSASNPAGPLKFVSSVFDIDITGPGGAGWEGGSIVYSPGDVVTLRGAIDGGPVSASGSGTVNGVFYPRLFLNYLIYFDGSAVVNSDGTAAGVFTASSTFFQVSSIGPEGLPNLIDGQVIGGGIAQVMLVPTFDGRFFSNRVTYNFTPIPEPATVLLLGVGLAGVVGKMRRRRLSQD